MEGLKANEDKVGKRMLIEPKYGWVTVSIGNWMDRASYLTDVPIDALDAFISSYNRWQPATIKFDAEGWEYIVVIDDYETYIIDYFHDGNLYDKPVLTTVKISKGELAKELVNDIQSHFDEWVNWCSNDSGTEELPKYEQTLRDKLKTLKDLIDIPEALRKEYM
ncbi:MAG: hypothetical protein RR365_13440 [Bacteroides sp.]